MFLMKTRHHESLIDGAAHGEQARAFVAGEDVGDAGEEGAASLHEGATRNERETRKEREERENCKEPEEPMEPKEALPLLGFRRRPPKGACPASAAVKRVCRIRACRSPSLAFSVVISVLMSPVIPLISAVGSSKSDLDCASCVSLPSFSAVA